MGGEVKEGLKAIITILMTLWAFLSYGEDVGSLSELHYTLGNLYSDEKDWDKAILEYEKALECNPDFAQAENNLGFVLYKKKDCKEAMVHYQRAIDLRPDYATALNNIGVIYYHFKEYKKAESFYRQAIKLNPDYAKAYLNLAACYFRQGRYWEATSQYLKAKKIDKEYVEERTDPQKLEAELKNAQKNDLENKEVKKMLAIIQERF
jgi:tetratricopeptide (TPR) repeat protein